MTAPTWNMLPSAASASHERFSLQVNPATPHQPLVICDTTTGALWPAIAIEPHPVHQFQIEEAYVREQDLIVRYAQSAADMFALQFQWRLISHPEPSAVGVELWVSIQTSYLDTAPSLVLTSDLPGNHRRILTHGDLVTGDDPGSTPASGTGGIIAEAGSSGPACAWFIEPRDLSQFHLLSNPDAPRQQGKLFGAFLEKGVIRRARMQLLMMEQSPTPQQLSDLYQSFASSPLPLTA